MRTQTLVTLQLASQILGVEPYRIIHLCESGCVKPTEDAEGRGTVRRFSTDDLFLLAVCLELQNAGVTAARIAKVSRLLSWLPRMQRSKEVFREGGLRGIIRHVGNREHPVMLHVKMPERGVHPTEPPMVLIQSAERLPFPPESGLGTCTTSATVDIWPVRVTLNLTFIASTIRLR